MTPVARLSGQPTHHRRDPSCSHAPDAPGLTHRLARPTAASTTRLPIHPARQHQPPQGLPHFLRIPRDSPASTGCDVRTVRHPPHTPGITPRVGTANDRLCHPTTHTLGRPTPTTPGLTTHLRTPWGSTHRLAQPMAAPASRLPIHSAGQHQPPQGSPRILHTPRDLPRQHQPPRDSPHGLARPIAAPPPDYPHTARQHQPPQDSPRISARLGTHHANTTTRHTPYGQRAEQPNRRRLRSCPA